MKYEVKNETETKRVVEIEIPLEEVKEEVSKILSEIRQNVQIKGFRPKKIPDSILFMRFGKDIQNQAGLTLIESSFPKAVEESGLEIASQPEFPDWTLNPAEPFKYTVRFEVMEPIVLGEYKGLEIPKIKPEVGEKELEEALERVQQSQATLDVIEEKEAQKGHFVTGKISISTDGESVAGWKNRNVEISLGEGKFFPGSDMEEKIPGAHVGEIHRFDLVFPEEYAYYRDFAGKTVQVELQVSELKKKRIPELDDELAKDLGLENLEELKKQLSADAVEKKAIDYDSKFELDIFKKLIKDNPFEVTEYLVNNQIEMMMQEFSVVDEQGKSALKDHFKPVAEDIVKRRLILDRIAELEKIEVVSDEIEEKFKEAVERTGKDEMELREEWYDNETFATVRKELARQKAFKLLKEATKIREITESEYAEMHKAEAEPAESEEESE